MKCPVCGKYMLIHKWHVDSPFYTCYACQRRGRPVVRYPAQVNAKEA
mgnify:FL=1